MTLIDFDQEVERRLKTEGQSLSNSELAALVIAYELHKLRELLETGGLSIYTRGGRR